MFLVGSFGWLLLYGSLASNSFSGPSVGCCFTEALASDSYTGTLVFSSRVLQVVAASRVAGAFFEGRKPLVQSLAKL